MMNGTLEQIDELAKKFDEWATVCERDKGLPADGGMLVFNAKEQRQIAMMLRGHVDAVRAALGIGNEVLEFTSSVYLRNGNAFLLVFHKRFNQWVPIGGRRELGERPQDTAKRELAEETGVTDAEFVDYRMHPLPGMPAGLVGYEEHDAGGRGTHMNFSFVMTVEHRNVMPCDEYHVARWWEQEEIDDLDMPENVRSILHNLYNPKLFSYPPPRGT
jgi:8-oxo-dGTP diphosphatase